MRIGAQLSGVDRLLLNLLSEQKAAPGLQKATTNLGASQSTIASNPTGMLSLSTNDTQRGIMDRTLSRIAAAADTVGQIQSIFDQIRTQIDTIHEKAAADVGQQLTGTERAANQSAINDAIDEINRLAATEINGQQVLNGAVTVNSSTTTISGLNEDQIVDFEVVSIAANSNLTISGTVLTTAQQAELSYQGPNVKNDATVTLSGDLGSTSISVTKGESLAAVRDRINAETSATGVTASLNESKLIINSVDYGSDAGVSVDVTSGEFGVAGGNGDGTANGIDPTAIINGQTLAGDGSQFSFNDASGSFTLEFDPTFQGDFDPITVSNTSTTSTTTQLQFSLSSNPNSFATLSIPGVQAASLGGLTGTLDQLATGESKSGLGTNADDAVRIADEALAQLTGIRNNVDNFATSVIDSARSLYSGLKEDLNAMRSTQNPSPAAMNSNQAKEYSPKAQQLDQSSYIRQALDMFQQRREATTLELQRLAGVVDDDQLEIGAQDDNSLLANPTAGLVPSFQSAFSFWNPFLNHKTISGGDGFSLLA